VPHPTERKSADDDPAPQATLHAPKPTSLASPYTGAMSDPMDKRARAWRIVGWVIAALAVVIVAGPQIIDLFGE